MTQRDQRLEEFKPMEEMNATQSVNADYSHLLSQANNKPSLNSYHTFRNSPTYSMQELNEHKQIVDRFLMKNPVKKKHAPSVVKVFTRLHNQALVKQRKNKQVQQQNNKKFGDRKNTVHTLGHSKSTYLKDSGLNTTQAKKEPSKHTRTKTAKELTYDANAGHRLYIKSRGQSSKRERSLKQLQRRKSMREQKLKDDLGKTSLMSPNSQWILDEKRYGQMFLSETTWNK